MREVQLGFLGCGNIGGGTMQALTQNADLIAHRDSLRFRVKSMLVRDLKKPRNRSVDCERLTQNPDEVIDDPEIEIILEFLGGMEPARTYILRALNQGKTVVTANKEVVARCWHELEAAARAGKAGLYFEASVAGGIPVIHTLFDSIQANRITGVMGIINGTTNYILERMTSEGVDYQEALGLAQELGLAEPDPTNDVEGIDAKYKLSILASLAFHTRIPVQNIHCQGITRITREDIAYAKRFGLNVKLLAIGKREGDRIEARVQPAFIPCDHPLSAVHGAYNAVFLHGDMAGDLMLYGKGAGNLPTASAIVSDLVRASHHNQNGCHPYTTFRNEATISDQVTIEDNWQTEYYIRVTVRERSGVLSQMAAVLGNHGISIRNVNQTEFCGQEVPVVFITHKTHEQDIRAAARDLLLIPDLIRVDNIVCVEGREV